MKRLLRMFVAVGLLALLSVSMTGCGGDGDNPTTPTPTPTGPPTGVLATFNNASSATVSWNPVADATSYNVYYAEASGVSKSVHDVDVNTAGTSYTFEGAEKLAVDTTYYFVVTAVKGSIESVESLEVSAKYTTFAQPDLTGTWNITLFYTGIGSSPANYLGWLRMNVTFGADGTATSINYYERSDGGTTPPPPPFILTIDEKGLVTQSGNYTGNTSHNVMSSNKELIIGTDTIPGIAPDTFVQVIRICQKAPDFGTMEESFSDADLANQSFVFHVLSSGAGQGWAYGAGTIDADRLATITSFLDSAGGTTPDPETETLVINPTIGVVTSTTDTNFKGVMTLDKHMIIGTTTDEAGTSFQLRVIQLTDPADPPTFTFSDLAGAYNFSQIFAGDPAQWQYGTLAINSSGVTNFPTFEDSILGSLDIDPITLSINAAGTITQAEDASFHGTMSANKELLVSTFTLEEGVYGLALAAK
jgi:hypothetical protein